MENLLSISHGISASPAATRTRSLRHPAERATLDSRAGRNGRAGRNRGQGAACKAGAEPRSPRPPAAAGGAHSRTKCQGLGAQEAAVHVGTRSGEEPGAPGAGTEDLGAAAEQLQRDGLALHLDTQLLRAVGPGHLPPP